MTEIAPLAVWGAKERDGKGWDRWHSWPRWREAEGWAIERGLAGDGLATYRIEFYLIDAPFARIFRYALDHEGRRFMADPAAYRKPALAEPVTVVLDELPPAELLGRR
jgi:hypothetical protein